MAERYWLILANTSSQFHRSISTMECRDLAQAEGHATRALRALRLTHDRGKLWDRWVIQARVASSSLPRTVAIGDHNGTSWSERLRARRPTDA